MRKNASRFFNFDLKARYGAPFDDFYVCPYNTAVCIDFQSSTHLVNGPALSGRSSAYNDCCGGWQEYMRQSMPGYGNQAKDADGAP
jgi:hypothetical protein